MTRAAVLQRPPLTSVRMSAASPPAAAGLAPAPSLAPLWLTRGSLAESALVAGAGPGVGERPAGLRDELPRVARRREGQLQDPVGRRFAALAVCDRGKETGEPAAPRARPELPGAACRIGRSVRVLRR